jgi:hypothetical protein
MGIGFGTAVVGASALTGRGIPGRAHFVPIEGHGGAPLCSAAGRCRVAPTTNGGGDAVAAPRPLAPEVQLRRGSEANCLSPRQRAGPPADWRP